MLTATPTALIGQKMRRSYDSSTILPQTHPGDDKTNSSPLPAHVRPKKEDYFTKRRGFLFAVILLALLAVRLRSVYAPPCDVPRKFSQIDEEAPDKIEDGKLGAVASESAVCSRHGTDMLKMGGNAADAVSGFHTRPGRDGQC